MKIKEVGCALRTYYLSSVFIFRIFDSIYCHSRAGGTLFWVENLALDSRL